MSELEYQLKFTTPAFLGNAERNGQWRTPPFKAQLRQWWRVAYAAARGFRVDIGEMRREEGLLLGNAWLENAFCKSQVRLRLDRWDEGKLRSWQGLEQATVYHPEVQKTHFQVGPHAYLGYGPLDGRGGTKLEKRNAAIQANEAAGFSLAFPEGNPLIEHALWLMHRYGTAGGRSRNGWGSYELAPRGETPELQGKVPLRPWRDCLQLDWLHAIGQDQKGALIWQTAEHDDWKLLMRTLAIIKIGLRTQFKFHLNAAAGDRQILKNGQPQGIEHGQAQNRHWLSYPVTNHEVRDWKRNSARLPNSLRFKVRKTTSGKLVGVIFHMPCLPPAAFNAIPHRAAMETLKKSASGMKRKAHGAQDARHIKQIGEHPSTAQHSDSPAQPFIQRFPIEHTWEKVHDLLDELVKAAASRTYTMIDDQTRRAALAPQLNTVAPLKRIPE